MWIERDHQVAVGAAFHVETTFLWESIFFFWMLQCESISIFVHSNSFTNNLTIIITIKNITPQPWDTTRPIMPYQTRLLCLYLKPGFCECRLCVFFSRYCAFIPTRAFSACATYSRWLRHKVTTAGRFVASASLWWWIHKPLLFANLGKVLKFLKRGDEVKMEYLLNIYSEAVDNKNDHVVE